MAEHSTAEERARSCAIAVMAKAPRPGRVKTRLCPPLLPEEASAMGSAFLRDITANLSLASRKAPIQPFVAYAPAGLEPLFAGLLASGTRLVLADGTGGVAEGVEGFGCCLLHAVRALFAQGWGAVCLLNADSPTLPTEFLQMAAETLLAPPVGGPADAAPSETGPLGRVVLGAAEDGGYYLIGLRAPHPQTFARITWSTGSVAGETRQRVREAGLELMELPPWYDVDDREALERLMLEISAKGAATGPEPSAALATRACIEAIGLRARLQEPC